jgi:hypothetical protein
MGRHSLCVSAAPRQGFAVLGSATFQGNDVNKRNLLNLVLLLVVVGLGLLAWLEPGREAPPAPLKLTALDVAAIDRIRIERPAGLLEMARADNRWQLTAPVTAPANGIRVDAILSVAAIDSLNSQAITGLDLAAYGLAEPAVRLFLNDTRIDFGNTSPLDQRRYVRVGDTVHLIPDLRYYQLIGGWNGYVSLRLLEPDTALDRIELPGLMLENHEGSWRPEPPPAHWSADAATALAQNWDTAQAMEVREHKGKANGEEVRLHIRGREQPIRFVVAARDPELVLVRPDLGLAWHLVSGQAQGLLELSALPENVSQPD